MQDASLKWKKLNKNILFKSKELNEKAKPQEDTFCHLLDAHYPDSCFDPNENEIVENYTSP